MTDIYRVQSGQSLSVIARDVLGDVNRWPELAFLNGLSHPYFIYPGQILELPPAKGSDIQEVTLEVDEPAQVATAPVRANLLTSPATVKWLVAGAVLYLLFRGKRHG